MKTESERYFEAFCERNGFKVSGVPSEATPTPDYTITVNGQSIVAEVKEVLPTAEEVESERLVKERGYGIAITTTPGARVRKKIGDCSPQIKARTQGKHPGMLVLWERGRCAGRHTEPYHIRVAMEGFEQVLVNVPHISSGASPSYAGMQHGGSRKMTETANTSISAVALLCCPGPDKMLLQVFHNRHAAVPLPPEWLRAPEVTQYALRDDPNGTTAWFEIEPMHTGSKTEGRTMANGRTDDAPPGDRG
jgi:hypothetical protein